MNGKSTRRASGMSSRSQGPGSSKRGSGKRAPTTMVNEIILWLVFKVVVYDNDFRFVVGM